MKLLVQADDYGFTKGVTAGIIDAIENGFLRNTGMNLSVLMSASMTPGGRRRRGDGRCSLPMRSSGRSERNMTAL